MKFNSDYQGGFPSFKTAAVLIALLAFNIYLVVEMLQYM